MPNYRVVFREEVERFYELNCRTPEEAEALAQDLYDDDMRTIGESHLNATMTSTTFVDTDVEPFEEEEIIEPAS